MQKKDANSLTIKLDMNFLEYPLWILDPKASNRILQIVKGEGRYILFQSKNTERLPNRTDALVLYYLLGQLNKTGFSNNKVSISRGKLSSEALGTRSKKNYERLKICLNRWEGVYVQFEKTFYDNKTKSLENRGFSITKNWKYNAITKKLHIRFADDFVKVLKNSTFYSLFDFKEYRRLSLPVSSRLFEILLKNFVNRPRWDIGIKKLGAKLTLTRKYQSQILGAVKKALKEVYQKTHLKIDLDYSNAKNICVFKKSFKPNKELSELIDTLPEVYRIKPICTLLSKWLKKKGVDYVEGNIKYTKENYSSNFRKYLEGALVGNWGIKEVGRCKVGRQLKEKADKDMYDKSWGIYNRLSGTEKTDVDRKIEIIVEMGMFPPEYYNKQYHLYNYFSGGYDYLLEE